MKTPRVVWYHVTFVASLPDIAARGLLPGRRPRLMTRVGRNLRGVYLTDASGLLFWFGRMEEFSHAESDNPEEDGLVPVVLRVETTCPVVEDVLGSEHARAAAVVCPRPIAPGAIRVWNGSSWVAVKQGVDEKLGVEWVDDEDLEAGGYWTLLAAHQSPLFPSVY